MAEKNSVVAIFETHSQAEDAVRELQKDGFDMGMVTKKAHQFGAAIASISDDACPRHD